ncbi:serine hydrolase domain-containing protein [Fodinicola feengrottensis]
MTDGTPVTEKSDHPKAATSAYEREVRLLQRDHRVPSVSAALARQDRPLWTLEVAGPELAKGTDAQYRIGSVTKTFTAVLVMQARDAGLLDLDDTVAQHLDVPRHGDLTIRRLLSHSSGLAREPYGDVWDTLDVPDSGKLLADLTHIESVLPTSRRFHYSNLGFAILGHLVARLAGSTWEELVVDRLIRPLGLTRTTVTQQGPVAQGYLVDAFSERVRPETGLDFGGVGPAAQLWSTAADMATWAAFLAKPDEKVLAGSTVDEMVHPLMVTDEMDWKLALGLGLMVVPRGDRVVHVGHTGGMPGFIAGVFCDRASGVGAAVLGASGTAGQIAAVPHKLLELSAELDEPQIQPWVPGEAPPDEIVSVLGHWWTEGTQFTFSWKDGKLEGRAAGQPKQIPPAIFERLTADLYRTVSGREAGEHLRLTRGDDGKVVRMNWATYRVTRDQQTF